MQRRSAAAEMSTAASDAATSPTTTTTRPVSASTAASSIAPDPVVWLPRVQPRQPDRRSGAVQHAPAVAPPTAAGWVVDESPPVSLEVGVGSTPSTATDTRHVLPRVQPTPTPGMGGSAAQRLAQQATSAQFKHDQVVKAQHDLMARVSASLPKDLLFKHGLHTALRRRPGDAHMLRQAVRRATQRWANAMAAMGFCAWTKFACLTHAAEHEAQVVRVQRVWRRSKHRRREVRMHRAAQAALQRLVAAAVCVQRVVRGHQARGVVGNLRRRHTAATVIQVSLRKHITASVYMRPSRFRCLRRRRTGALTGGGVSPFVRPTQPHSTRGPRACNVCGGAGIPAAVWLCNGRLPARSGCLLKPKPEHLVRGDGAPLCVVEGLSASSP